MERWCAWGTGKKTETGKTPKERQRQKGKLNH